MFSGFSSGIRLGRRSGNIVVKDPTQLTALQIWYNADIANSINFNVAPSNASDISQWKDRSGTGHNANQSGNASVKPNWYSNIQNGYGVVRFNGTTESLNINPLAWAQNLSGFTLFVVARLGTLSGQRPLCGTDADGLRIDYDGALNVWGVKTSGGQGDSTIPGETSQFHVFGLVFDGSKPDNIGKLKFRYDGVNQDLTYTGTVGSTTSGTATTFYVGQDVSNNFFQGEVGEMLMFTRTLNNNELLGVESYLKLHWGL